MNSVNETTVIPTAEQFFKDNCYDKQGGLRAASDVAIDYTKLHVDAALNSAAANVKHHHRTYDKSFLIDKFTILQAYPHHKIK